MMNIYLVGYISGAKIEQCIAWRKRIREHYDNWKKPIYESDTNKNPRINLEAHEWLRTPIVKENKTIVGYRKEKYPITWLDPLNGQEIGTITSKGLKSNIPGKAFVHRDFNCVKMADLLIANLDTFGDTRPLTGSIYELAWGWYFKTPTIIITTEQNYKEHPFIVDTASIIVPSVDELLEKKYINYFYKGMHGAIY